MTKLFSADGRDVPIRIVVNPRARRLTLRADAVRGAIQLSVPPRTSASKAERLISDHGGWIAAQVARWPAALPFVHGATLPFGDGVLTLDWHSAHPRTVTLDGARLLLGGPAATVAGRTRRWLRAAALSDLTAATQALAATLGRTVSVTVRDPASRWGSCSATGAIGYSWRLILAPRWVRQSVVAHEVAHLLQPNHSAAFWALAATLTEADLPTARAWLRTNGAALHWVGRQA